MAESASIWSRGPRLAAMMLVCVWLVQSGCECTRSERDTREYKHTLVVELCAPGAFYRECWWTGDEECHEEMARMVSLSMPTASKRVVASAALRQDVLERLYLLHTTSLAAAWGVWEFDVEACWDGTPWKHVPPGNEGRMTAIRARVEEQRRSRRDAPTTTDTAPVPSFAPASTP